MHSRCACFVVAQRGRPSNFVCPPMTNLLNSYAIACDLHSSLSGSNTRILTECLQSECIGIPLLKLGAWLGQTFIDEWRIPCFEIDEFCQWCKPVSVPVASVLTVNNIVQVRGPNQILQSQTHVRLSPSFVNTLSILWFLSDCIFVSV